ncbi:MAG: DUF975 family protein [Actinomycetes bacterium]|jgi:uncharacterized membrane protein|nr:DUF975 family protein [Actinomycetes bacterium]
MRFVRKEIKRAGRQALRRNFAACLVVGILASVVVTGVVSVQDVTVLPAEVLENVFKATGATGALRVLRGAETTATRIKRATSIGDDSTAGVISGLYRSSRQSGGLSAALLRAVNAAVFHHRLSRTILMVSGLVLSFAFVILVRESLRVGVLRFFQENEVGGAGYQAPISRVLFVWQQRRVWCCARTALWKLLWLLVWSPTVVMLPVKYYAYILTGQILAENPGIGARAALRLSQKMMRGNKWRYFLFDLSFALWDLLGFFSFGILLYVWVNPYRYAAHTRLYEELRSGWLAAHSGDAAAAGLLPGIVVPVSTSGFRSGFGVALTSRANWRRDYTVLNLLLLFFVFSFIGWLYESSLCIVSLGRFINRGTLYGPWLPIYGAGGVAVLVLLRRVREHPLATFFLSMLVCGVIEYAAATFLWDSIHLKYWDYTGYFFNIQGRTCLEGLIVFGLGCCTAIYLAAPLADSLLNRIPRQWRLTLAGLLVALFAADNVVAHIHPREGYGVISETVPSPTQK